MKRPLFPLYLTVFVDVLGLTLVIPLLPFYAEHYGASPLMVGLFLASYSACQLFSGPLLGRLSDRVGRKPVLLVSQTGTMVGFLILATATNLPMLFLGRMLDGATAGNLSVAQAAIADQTPPERRTKAFALIGIAFGVGFLVGPAISGVLAQRLGYPAPAYAAAGLSALSVLTTATLLPHRAPTGTSGGATRSDSFLRFLGVSPTRRWLLEFFSYIFAFAILTGGLALFLERRYEYQVEQVGYVFAYLGFCGILIQGGLVGRLAKRLGEARLSGLGFASLGIGAGLLGFATTLPHLLVLTTLGAFGASVVRPSLTTLITKSVGEHEQGEAIGVSQSLGSLGQLLGPIVAGYLIGRGWLGAYGAAVGVVAFAALACRFLLRPVAPERVGEP